MPNYRRARSPGGHYFFTVNACGHRLLGDAFRAAKASRPFNLTAVVVLPDHLHCLWQLPPDDVDYAIRWRHLKAEFSRRLGGVASPNASQSKKRERGIWQRRSGAPDPRRG